MRKILLFLYIVAISSALLLCYYGDLKYTNQEEFFTIKENAGYVYGENRTIKFNVYSNNSNTLIAYPEKNQYSLVFDYAEFTLNNVSVEKTSMDDYYVYTLEASLDNCFIGQNSDNVILKIINSKYKLELNIGGFSCISNEAYPLLSFESLSPAYSFCDQMLYFCGINLELDSKYHIINSVEIGKNAYGALKLCQNAIYEGTIAIKNIIPSYDINYKSTGMYELKNSLVFIPFSYRNIELIRRHYILITIDNVTYYIDSILYYPSDLILGMYDSFKEKGVITYA